MDIKNFKFYRVKKSIFEIYYWISLYDVKSDVKIGICYRTGEISFVRFYTDHLKKICLFNFPEDVRNSFVDFMNDPLFEIEFERFKRLLND